MSLTSYMYVKALIHVCSISNKVCYRDACLLINTHWESYKGRMKDFQIIAHHDRIILE